MSSATPSSSGNERSVPKVPDVRVTYAPLKQTRSSYSIPLTRKPKS
jgi:hypothetical protein